MPARLGAASTVTGFQRQSESMVVSLPPANATREERFAHYAALIRANGGEVNPKGMPTVLGLRGLSRDGSRHAANAEKKYNDTVVVLLADGRLREFDGSTHPAYRTSNQADDVNGDGKPDVGHLAPGNFIAVATGTMFGAPAFRLQDLNGSRLLSAYRDTNHDGAISPAERQKSKRRGDRMSGTLIHQDIEYSIGCQTLSTSDWEIFVRIVGGAKGRFSYSLVSATE